MVSERLKTLFGKVKNELDKRRRKIKQIKPEDIAKFATKEAIYVIPVVGQIIKDAFDEFSPDEKEELLKELNELSEAQFNEISEKVGVSVEYLKDIRGITLYTFEELRADHEEIKKLLLHLIEIQTREINIPTIQAVLRKGETYEGDFFKKEPEWIDFEEGFVVERKEVYEIINKLENDNIQLVLGEPASGKSVILKNIGFKLANANKDVYVVELKKYSRDDAKRSFDDILKIKDEKAVFIVDDVHLYLSDCERLVREFKNKKLKTKLIIGSRPTREIRGEHPKEASIFEYLSKTDVHAEDVTEEMIKRFLVKKHGFSAERITTVSRNLEAYKKDLWLLSWALKAYDPKKDSVEDREIYEKVKDSIRNMSAGKDKPVINAEDVFLPLSIFYRFEIPVERDFLEEQLEIEEDKINKLIELSEIIETEEIGRNRMLSLIHSSIADLYFETYQAYPSLGRKTKKKILNQSDEDLQYCLFYKYMTSTNPRNDIDVVDHLGRWLAIIGWLSEKREVTLFKKLIEDEGVKKSIKEGVEKEEDVGKIGKCLSFIVRASKEVAREIIDPINIDTLLLKIEQEEDLGDIALCMGGIVSASEEAGLKLVDTFISRIEKEEDIVNIGMSIGWMRNAENEEIVLKLVDSVSSKIEKEEDTNKIGMCLWFIRGAIALEIINNMGVDVLSSKMEKEDNENLVGFTLFLIAEKISKEKAQEISNRLNPELRDELKKGRWLK